VQKKEYLGDLDAWERIILKYTLTQVAIVRAGLI
jgi:hypothetical protein